MVEVDRGVLARDTYVTRPQDTTAQELEIGSVGEAVAGTGALVLAILGLIGILPVTLAAIATIAMGAALLLGGGAAAGRYARVGSVAPARARQEIAGALGFQALAGIGGVVLGVLALLRIRPIVLLAIGALVFGVALPAGASGTTRLARSARWLRGGGERSAEPEPAYAAGGWEALVGIGVGVLGILALVGYAPLTLVLVALLSAGAAVLFIGSYIAARLLGYFA